MVNSTAREVNRRIPWKQATSELLQVVWFESQGTYSRISTTYFVQIISRKVLMSFSSSSPSMNPIFTRHISSIISIFQVSSSNNGWILLVLMACFCENSFLWSLASYNFSKYDIFCPVLQDWSPMHKLYNVFKCCFFVTLRFSMKPMYLPWSMDCRCGMSFNDSKNLLWVAKGRSHIIFITVFQDLFSFRCSSELSDHRGES